MHHESGYGGRSCVAEIMLESHAGLPCELFLRSCETLFSKLASPSKNNFYTRVFIITFITMPDKLMIPVLYLFFLLNLNPLPYLSCGFIVDDVREDMCRNLLFLFVF